MTLTPWKSLWELRFPTLREEMDKLFEDFFDKTGFSAIKEGTWLPAVDVHETKKDVVVTFDLPSIDPKDVSISIVEDRLTVKGERKREEEIKETDYFRSERVYGAFQRVVQLPTEVVADKAKATYKDGVLKITVPKTQKAMPKEIKVEIE
ncbi:MAG TPA: Hsp20/alpha crystallin family protein [Syntrophorhabdaceae bacterium]|nr:Hsp20/alpha crystallin family protein [Syntrophorhabdaceae bacterium]HOL04879.1 Hsp20/alpha crystallin family protein [Syntrophorhabdaceae bacterium]HON84423.1 Hsp20/alpha crystallin family protein [Syntrophorhabdaceae bacterium]HOT41162.1 Hsp20/alpha crystallin family protein [Syntrophorhabdaceae bacterium]HPC65775.1 Hsp20/alpha crystallin family protein [Syntrophorhabdaceae bacterium]